MHLTCLKRLKLPLSVPLERHNFCPKSQWLKGYLTLGCLWKSCFFRKLQRRQLQLQSTQNLRLTRNADVLQRFVCNFFSSSALKVKTAGAQNCCEFGKASDTGSWSFFVQGAQTPHSSYVTGRWACHLLHGLGGCLRIQLLQRVSNIEFRIIQMFNQSHHTHIVALFVFKWERLTKSDTALMAYQERREASTYGELYSILAQHLDMDYVWREKRSSVQNPRLVVLLWRIMIPY